ncbi:hypothetical protein [Streptomyces sp. NPDC047079]|uniref:hypothetical protein n=1 Tax=Streptomyces sp. NPDC047079 TaxID=3154607 RepID=UPI0033ECB390
MTPDEVGMPPGLRCRAPGPRREEVARLSGVGVSWYARLGAGPPDQGLPAGPGAADRPGHPDPHRRPRPHPAVVCHRPYDVLANDPADRALFPGPVIPEIRAANERWASGEVIPPGPRAKTQGGAAANAEAAAALAVRRGTGGGEVRRLTH